MKIVFDYNNVNPNEIANAIKFFYEKYKNVVLKENGEEIGCLEFGKINLYISVKSSYDNSSIAFTDDKGEIDWIVKNKKMASSKRKLIHEDEENNIYIYRK